MRNSTLPYPVKWLQITSTRFRDWKNLFVRQNVVMKKAESSDPYFHILGSFGTLDCYFNLKVLIDYTKNYLVKSSKTSSLNPTYNLIFQESNSMDFGIKNVCLYWIIDLFYYKKTENGKSTISGETQFFAT